MSNGSANARVTVNHAAANLKAVPEKIDVSAGGTLTVQIRPPVAAGGARTKQDGGSPEWLTGTSDASSNIVLTAPADGFSDEYYKYSITVDGVGTLDPRARVVR